MAGHRAGATKGGVSAVCEPLGPDRPLWFPGSSPPPWLDGSLPGDFGFDPLGLGSDPELLRWFAQAELMHSRWAMLAVAGILVPEVLEKWGFMEDYSWIDAGARDYFADPWTLFVSQMALMGWAEGRRWADYLNPGCVAVEPRLPNRRNPVPDVGYPGGLWFDWGNWGRGSRSPSWCCAPRRSRTGGSPCSPSWGSGSRPSTPARAPLITSCITSPTPATATSSRHSRPIDGIRVWDVAVYR
ncbi:hypothetical protein OsJ_29513 [Oryza sativa Japonica Group]|uniref:Chlorophyll a-b binding protein, chloroplastic n=1 Tax=Oryza sativa subsp. japonica TaxID=39947 RepID=A3BZ84_ORYSJ|nr:hypothetical protein OsJ_29513 [Oryza sativa Japonica Group]